VTHAKNFKSARPTARVVVIEGSFDNTTAAKYIRQWVRETPSVSCLLSHQVLDGMQQIVDLTTGYDTLQKNTRYTGCTTRRWQLTRAGAKCVWLAVTDFKTIA
jgi:hypothetical protein